MPITYTIDRDARLIRSTVSGEFSAADMLACVTGAAAEAREPGYHVLSDHRGISRPARREELELMAARLAELSAYYRGARWAAVVSDPASFGMMRMMSVLAERVPMLMQVFEDAGEAEAWAKGGR